MRKEKVLKWSAVAIGTLLICAGGAVAYFGIRRVREKDVDPTVPFDNKVKSEGPNNPIIPDCDNLFQIPDNYVCIHELCE